MVKLIKYINQQLHDNLFFFIANHQLLLMTTIIDGKIHFIHKSTITKKKVQKLGHCPNRGEGGSGDWMKCPNLLKC